MNPGDVWEFEEGGRLALVVGIGVWAERQGKGIQIHLTGTPDFHTTVTNRNLRRLLLAHGRWPFGEEGGETQRPG